MARLAVHRKSLVLGDDPRSMLAVVRSLGRNGVEVHTGWQPDGSVVNSSRYVHTAHSLPRYDMSLEWRSALIDLMTKERFDLIIPCSDPAQIPLQRHRTHLEPFGKIYLLDDKTFEVITNKLRVNALARSAGVRLPREMVVQDAGDIPTVRAEFSLPLVLKPCSSFDTRSVGERRAVRKAFSWDDFVALVGGMLSQGPVAVQENFIGQGVGVEFLLDRGEPLLEFQHVRIHEPLHGGGSYYRKGVPVTTALRDAALAILRPLKYTGVAMAEFKVNPTTGDWVFIEINGRFWGSLPLAVASGANFPFALFELLVNGRVESRPPPRSGLYCRYWTGDLNWQLANLRANRSDPTLATQPLPTVVRETVVNLVTLRERSDTFTLDDPKPGLTELTQIFRQRTKNLAQMANRKWLQSGLVRRRLRTRAMKVLRTARNIVFVCKGNICRSPFACQVAKGAGTTDQTWHSAGYYPKADRPAPAAALLAAEKLGINLESHRSVQLTDAHVRNADAIFVFDYENYEKLVSKYKCTNKLFPLGALTPSEPIWIDDPYGRDVDVFITTYKRIQEAVLGLFPNAPVPGPLQPIVGA